MSKIELFGNITMMSNIEAGFTYSFQFDPTDCSVFISGSYAVDTFNCYDVGEDQALPEAGHGFSSLWNVSTSSYLNPADVSGSMGFWDANTITASNSSSFSIWEDSSANARHLTQSNASLQPRFLTNQLPNSSSAVFFHDTYFFVPAISGQTEYEVFILLKNDYDPALGTNQSGLWRFGPTGASNATQFPDASGVLRDNFATTVQKEVGNQPKTLTKWIVYNSRSKANLWQASIDGNVVFNTTTNTVTMPTGGLTIGYENYNNGTLHLYYWGRIAMMAIFSRYLTDQERAGVYRFFDVRRSFYTI